MDETLTPLSDGDAGTPVARPTDHEVGRVELVQLYVGIVREQGDRSRSREIVHDDVRDAGCDVAEESPLLLERTQISRRRRHEGETRRC